MPQSRKILASPMLGKLTKPNIGLQIQTNAQPSQFWQFSLCSCGVSRREFKLSLDSQWHGTCGLWKAPGIRAPSSVLTILPDVHTNHPELSSTFFMRDHLRTPSQFFFLFLIRFKSSQCSSHRRKTKGTLITSQVWDAGIAHFSQPLVRGGTLKTDVWGTQVSW